MKSFKSLAVKLGLAVFSAAALGFATLGLYFTHVFSRQIDLRLDTQARIPARLMNEQVLPYRAVRDIRSVSDLVGEPVAYAEVIRGNRAVYYSSDPAQEGTMSSCAIGTAGESDCTIVHDPQHTSMHVASQLFADGHALGELHLEIDIRQATAKKRAVAASFFTASLVCTLFTSLTGSLLIRRLTLPRIKDSLNCLKLASDGEYAARIRVGGTYDELGMLECGINSMIAHHQARKANEHRLQIELNSHRLHLEEMVRQRTKELNETLRRLKVWDDTKNLWLNLVSHEMRTPLTGLIGTADLLFSVLPKNHEMHELRKGYDLSVDRMNKLISDAMMLTETHLDGHALNNQTLDWGPFFKQACWKFKEHKPGTNFSLSFDPASNVAVKADPELLERALVDLMLTADHCVRSHESIAIATWAGNERVVAEIATDGKSLPEQDLEVFFEVGGQRTLLKGGADFGLGPVLSHRIVQLFKGTCTVYNGEGKGIVIRMELPLAPRPPATGFRRNS